MATFIYFNSYSTELAKGTHANALNANTDTLKLYLSNTTPSVSTHTIKADLPEIATGNGYAGPIDLINAAIITGAIIKVDGTDVTVTAAGGPIPTFRYAIVYNDTIASPLDPLIGYWDNGSPVDLADTQSFTVTFGAEMFSAGG